MDRLAFRNVSLIIAIRRLLSLLLARKKTVAKWSRKPASHYPIPSSRGIILMPLDVPLGHLFL